MKFPDEGSGSINTNWWNAGNINVNSPFPPNCEIFQPWNLSDPKFSFDAQFSSDQNFFSDPNFFLTKPKQTNQIKPIKPNLTNQI